MAFPVVEATNTSVTAVAGTTHTVSLPAGIVAGDLLVAILLNAEPSNSHSPPSGWTELLDDGQGRTIASKVADGGEGASVDFTSTVSGVSAHRTYRISGSTGTVTGQVALAVDPPDFAPAWGADDTLWLALALLNTSDAGDLTAGPTDYSDFVKTAEVTGSTVRSRIGSAWRQLNAASENPSAYSFTGTLSASRGVTLAVQPSVSANARRMVGGGLTESRLIARARLITAPREMTGWKHLRAAADRRCVA